MTIATELHILMPQGCNMPDNETVFLRTLERNGLILPGAPTREDFVNVIPVTPVLKAKDDEVRLAVARDGRAALSLADRLNRLYAMALGPYAVITLITDKRELGSSGIFQEVEATILAGDVQLPSAGNPEGALRFGGIMDEVGIDEATVPPGYNPRLRFHARQRISPVTVGHLSVMNQLSLVGDHVSEGGIMVPVQYGVDARHVTEAQNIVNDGSLGQQTIAGVKHAGDGLENERQLLGISSKGPNPLLRVNYWASKKIGLNTSINYVLVVTEDTLEERANTENALQKSQLAGFDSVIKHSYTPGSAEDRFKDLIEPTV